MKLFHADISIDGTLEHMTLAESGGVAQSFAGVVQMEMSLVPSKFQLRRCAEINNYYLGDRSAQTLCSP